MLVGRGNLVLWLYWAVLGLIPGRENGAFHHQSLQGVKLPGRKIDYSPLSSTEVRLSGVVPPFPLYTFMTLTETTDP